MRYFRIRPGKKGRGNQGGVGSQNRRHFNTKRAPEGHRLLKEGLRIKDRPKAWKKKRTTRGVQENVSLSTDAPPLKLLQDEKRRRDQRGKSAANLTFHGQERAVQNRRSALVLAGCGLHSRAKNAAPSKRGLVKWQLKRPKGLRRSTKLFACAQNRG